MINGPGIRLAFLFDLRLSYLNCTFHPLDVYPAGVLVPPQNKKSKIKVAISPGEYEVFDSIISGGKSFVSITVLEGEIARIKTDGLGNSYSCP